MLEPEHDSANIDAAMQHWRQGDLALGEHWFVFRTVPGSGDGEDTSDLVEHAVRGLVVLTQTCDLVRSYTDRPYVEVSPLVEVSLDELRLIQRAARPRYAAIPGVAEMNLVADLDRVMTVDKSAVAQWARVAGCTNDGDVREFALALSRKRLRFAYPDDFVELVDRLRDRVVEKYGRATDEGAALRGLREIRVAAAPSWDAETVSITFWFVKDDQDSSELDWGTLVEGWINLVPASGRFQEVLGQAISVDDLSARDYIKSDPLDLDRLSGPRAAVR